MAVLGIGVDIVEIERMGRVLARTPRFAERVFTQEERDYCARRANPDAAFAGCFAAREAVLKALGVGFGAGVGFRDVAVGHDSKGKPLAILSGGARKAAEGQGVTEVHISVTHTRGVAVANALAVTREAVPARTEKVDESAMLAARFKEAKSLLDELDRKGE